MLRRVSVLLLNNPTRTLLFSRPRPATNIVFFSSTADDKDKNTTGSSNNNESTNTATEGAKADATVDPVITALKQDLEKAKKESAEMKDRALRALADMENLRVRTAKEVTSANRYGATALAKAILEVSDNLERALETVPKSMLESEKSVNDSPNAESKQEDTVAVLRTLVEGIGMTERTLAAALQKNGIIKFNPLGEVFDPTRHLALFEMPVSSKDQSEKGALTNDNAPDAQPENLPPGRVGAVMKVGFMYHERVLRAAEVGVTKIMESK